VLDKPRILDVPEQPVYPTISGPLFADLSFAELTPQKPPEEIVGPPVPIASIRDRALAALIDTVMVAIGIAGFLVVALHFMNPAPARTLLVTSGTAAATVWFIYEYLFVVKGAATVGMKLLRLQLVNFSGQPAALRQRRHRAFAMPLSAVSLLGFLWAFADEDSLCWHDRMSQTYLSR
jgi:uncharacterized RDD family membrane protein YckC